MSSPYYNMPTSLGGAPQPPISSPSMQPQPGSPLHNNASRKPKRFYPGMANQSIQGSHSPIPQPSYPSTPSPTAASYGQITNGFAAMQVNPPPINQPNSLDVVLTGRPPLIEDLHLSPPAPTIPPNISVTSSPGAQCSAHFYRSTLNAIPRSRALLKKSKLPLALILEPHQILSPEEEPPVAYGPAVIRCTRCQAYINPFVRLSSTVLKWQCNICDMDNDVPAGFDWDELKQERIDYWSRPELNHGCVDFIATEEFITHPPQPPAFVFVIDTSFKATQARIIEVVLEAIQTSLDMIPNEDGRTKVAFITVDNSVSFYKLDEGEPEVLVVGDIADIYLPHVSSNLIVNLKERRSAVDTFLKKMLEMGSQSTSPSNCLGPALLAAQKLLVPVGGGKIICFQASLPNLGDGAVKQVVDKTSLLDTPIMKPSNTFYKMFAMDSGKHQVCTDVFVFGSEYSDVATLNVIPRFTGGQTHFFPGFDAKDEAERIKVKEDVMALLAEKVGLEAVMRTRCSQGLMCQSFHGNSMLRSGVMALPNVPVGQSYCVEIDIEEDIQKPVAFFQTALLYTNCSGERRIRVMNLCLPVTDRLPEVFSNADQIAVARALCHQAITQAATEKLGRAREQLAKTTIDIFSAYRQEVGTGQAGGMKLSICRELSLLPLLVLGLLKSETFNENPAIPVDIRAFNALLLRTISMDAWLRLVHPNFYALHKMQPTAGTIDPSTGRCIFPQPLELSSEKFESYGCYLMDNGQQLSLWVGKEAVPQLCIDLLGEENVKKVISGRRRAMPAIQTPIAQRVNAMITDLRSNRKVTYYPTLDIVREDEDTRQRAIFLSRLVSDRQNLGSTGAGANQQHASSGMSYFQWIGFLLAKCNQ